MDAVVLAPAVALGAAQVVPLTFVTIPIGLACCALAILLVVVARSMGGLGTRASARERPTSSSSPRRRSDA